MKWCSRYSCRKKYGKEILPVIIQRVSLPITLSTLLEGDDFLNWDEENCSSYWWLDWWILFVPTYKYEFLQWRRRKCTVLLILSHTKWEDEKKREKGKCSVGMTWCAQLLQSVPPGRAMSSSWYHRKALISFYSFSTMICLYFSHTYAIQLQW